MRSLSDVSRLRRSSGNKKSPVIFPAMIPAKKIIILLFLLFTNIPVSAAPTITLATTTSVYESGLLDKLLPVFEKKYSCHIKVVAVGTGQAIRLGQDGNADILFVHDPAAEEKFVREGFGTKRYSVFSNDFVIVGPSEDPAGIKKANSVSKAFQLIAAASVPFVSRGDNSGTHKKELTIWKILDKSGKIKTLRYIESGAGMQQTLRIADEKNAYCLTDRTTWLVHLSELQNLKLLFENDPLLINHYSVIPVSPDKYPGANYQLAKKFADFITGPEGQKIIAEFSREIQKMNYFDNGLHQALKMIFPPDPEILKTVLRSYFLSGSATLIATLIGLALALLTVLHEFRLKKLLITLFNTWLALPAVTIGLLVYIFLSRRGPFGYLGFLFTPYAIIIAQTILATPLVTALAIASLSSIPAEIRETALTLGANKFQVIAVVLREAKFSLTIAVLTAFSRVLGETGMTLMVGGNIRGSTRVMTTAIALETMKGNWEIGIALGIILVVSALILNIILQFLRSRLTEIANGNNR